MKKITSLIIGALLITGLAGCGQPAQEEQDEYVTSTVNTPNLPVPQSACAEACKNYVNKCLTLVPNADQDLFQQGQDTCEEDCVNWDQDKIQCMINAPICEDMTYVCGL